MAKKAPPVRSVLGEEMDAGEKCGGQGGKGGGVYIIPQGQGQNLALTVLHVPYSLESGFDFRLASSPPQSGLLKSGYLWCVVGKEMDEG